VALLVVRIRGDGREAGAAPPRVESRSEWWENWVS
jgi:hypothetical protein